MNTAIDLAQQATYGALENAVSGYAVYYDRAPKNTTEKHVVVGDSTEDPRHTFANRGYEGVEVAHVWTPGSDSEGHRAAMVGVIDALSDVGRVENVQVLSEPEWLHGVVRVRLWNREGA